MSMHHSGWTGWRNLLTPRRKGAHLVTPPFPCSLEPQASEHQLNTACLQSYQKGRGEIKWPPTEIIKKKSERKFQIPPHDSCLQHYSPEMIQNVSPGPHRSSPPLEFLCVLPDGAAGPPSTHFASASCTAPTPPNTKKTREKKKFSASSIRRKTGYPCF